MHRYGCHGDVHLQVAEAEMIILHMAAWEAPKSNIAECKRYTWVMITDWRRAAACSKQTGMTLD